MIPSLDAHLINLMGFAPTSGDAVHQVGCAAGAMALAGADFLKAHPGGNVLIIAVELPSYLSRKDISQAKSDFVILFAMRCRALVTGGKYPSQDHGSETYTFPDSLGAMGFDLRDSLSHPAPKDVPEMIVRNSRIG